MPQNSRDEKGHALARARETLFHSKHQYRAYFLLLALVLQILQQGTGFGSPLLPILLRALIVIAAIFMTADNRRHLMIGLGLGIPGLILILYVGRLDNHPLELITYLIFLAFYLFVIKLMLGRIFKATVITHDTIGLAICTYLLIGSIWVLFYAPVVASNPAAFSHPIITDPDPFHTLTYFSFVTLTTLGYGDLSPVSVVARNLAVLEALTGTLFLAVLISRLVGSYGKKR